MNSYAPASIGTANWLHWCDFVRETLTECRAGGNGGPFKSLHSGGEREREREERGESGQEIQQVDACLIHAIPVRAAVSWLSARAKT